MILKSYIPKLDMYYTPKYNDISIMEIVLCARHRQCAKQQSFISSKVAGGTGSSHSSPLHYLPL